jgi:hypothetical protein
MSGIIPNDLEYRPLELPKEEEEAKTAGDLSSNLSRATYDLDRHLSCAKKKKKLSESKLDGILNA